jgi:O-antigen/teichoic acid export membrane protein
VLPERASVPAALIVRGPAIDLTKGVAIYGAGDVLAAIVNFVLLGVYVKFDILTRDDYGALGLILAVEAFTKIASRWGFDGAFMRFYHEREEGPARRRMASTIVWFLLAVNSVMLGAALISAPWIASALELEPQYLPSLQLMFVNIVLISFTFIPLHAMRLQKQAVTYSAFTFARTVSTIVLRVVLVIGFGFGVTGIYLTDLVVTVGLLLFMAPWFRSLLAWTFSGADLRESLRFSLPRVPAGMASQALDGVPRILLGQHFPHSQVGIYQNGTTLGAGVAIFKAAFETAWAPFYYETARKPDAKVILGRMITYGVAALALLVAGTAAIARDAILLVLRPEYLDALPVVPMIGLAMGLQGVYQLTSIGLNLTRRTEFYSVATICAALSGVGAGVVLIPRFGVVGAAETVLLAYTVQLVIASVLSHSVYPIPFEVGRLVRVVTAAVAAAVVAVSLPEMPPLVGFLARGVTTVAVYAGVLAITGFFRASERAFLRELINAH